MDYLLSREKLSYVSSNQRRLRSMLVSYKSVLITYLACLQVDTISKLNFYESDVDGAVQRKKRCLHHFIPRTVLSLRKERFALFNL